MTDNIQTLMDRKYHTNIYTDLAYRFIKAFAYVITFNGKHGIEYYTGTFMNIEREPDGEIVLSFKKDNNRSAYYSECYFCKSAFYKKHTEFLNWFGRYGMCNIKDKYPKAWIKENWKRNNTNKFTKHLFHDFDSISKELTISDIYLIYDSLCGRTKRLNDYSAKQKAKIIGEPFDPVTAELERARRDEIAALKKECQKQLVENQKTCSEKLESLKADLYKEAFGKNEFDQKKCREKYESLRADLYKEAYAAERSIKDEFNQKIEEINNSVNLAACLTD